MTEKRVLGAGMVVWLVFALLQLNDPDPGFWLMVYGLTLLYSIGAYADRLPRAVAVSWTVLLLVIGVWMYASWESAQPMHAGSTGLTGDEVARELGGLFLAAGWMGWLGYRAEK